MQTYHITAILRFKKCLSVLSSLFHSCRTCVHKTDIVAVYARKSYQISLNFYEL